jgi:hypothetical protein
LQSLPERTDTLTALELLFSLSPKAGLIAISFGHVSERLHVRKIKHNFPLIALISWAGDFSHDIAILANVLFNEWRKNGLFGVLKRTCGPSLRVKACQCFLQMVAPAVVTT